MLMIPHSSLNVQWKRLENSPHHWICLQIFRVCQLIRTSALVGFGLSTEEMAQCPCMISRSAIAEGMTFSRGLGAGDRKFGEEAGGVAG